ncbi:TetR/AcrR family transcriptional regulator C-terminal domain-containing protein [Amycolatopsis methanolica]|nr:TetR/AcrR family transcriptional regulator C-terminal domain-containing protein [Amycolatopsis methanolica]
MTGCVARCCGPRRRLCPHLPRRRASSSWTGTARSRLHRSIDREQFPLTASMVGHIFAPDTDAAFEAGQRLILSGLRTTYLR